MAQGRWCSSCDLENAQYLYRERGEVRTRGQTVRVPAAPVGSRTLANYYNMQVVLTILLLLISGNQLSLALEGKDNKGKRRKVCFVATR